MNNSYLESDYPIPSELSVELTNPELEEAFKNAIAEGKRLAIEMTETKDNRRINEMMGISSEYKKECREGNIHKAQQGGNDEQK
ncbi:hypothetical protein [Histophilus somni]|uniref:Uncharacterized protein n=1 Tax=Histophilus somni (strain 129Pt) TaxID=205914 RepID=Q0I222_HISS1|nr:hypothetical protein [Histophilus somni]